MTARRLAVLLVVALLATSTPALAQCAMCKTALIGSAEGQAMSREFNRAILVMLFAPYIVCGGFLLMAFRTRIRARLGWAWRGLRERCAALTRPLPGLP